jgi:putative ABC transport system substrate-binding protein
MRRREFVAFVAGAIVTRSSAAIAQEAGRTYRLGALWPFPRNTREAGLLGDELRRHGFIEGQNLTIEYRAWAPHVDLISNMRRNS